MHKAKVRVNFQNSLFHHIYFILPYGLSGRNNLTVDIRQTHFIVIHQDK